MATDVTKIKLDKQAYVKVYFIIIYCNVLECGDSAISGTEECDDGN